jgi:hypothetical protein
MIPYLMSLLGSAVLIGAIAQNFRLVFKWQRLAWLPIACSLLCLFPVGGLSVGRWIHSFTGYVSIPLVILLASYLLAPLVAPRVQYQKLLHHYWLLMVMAGAIYFPMSMGLGNFDPHELGWQAGFVWVPVGLTIVAILRGNNGLAGLLMSGTIAWQLNLFGNRNGWAYLIDPLAVGFSAAGLTGIALKRLFARGETRGPQNEKSGSQLTSDGWERQSKAA